MELPSRVLVVGLGESGVAAAQLAAGLGAEVWATDRRPEGELAAALEALPAGVRTFLGGHPEAALEGVGLVVTSPGVPAELPLLAAARHRGIAVWPEIELAWRCRPEAPLIAVTGSNGKSTVTVLAAEMLRAAGIAAREGGNLGPPACRLVLEGGFSAWVLEVSSFQAEALVELRPRVAVVTNLSQDHLERHPDMDRYAAAKFRLLARQTREDAAVLNADDPRVAAAPTAARRLGFSLEREADGWLDGGTLRIGGAALLEASRLRIGGRHNLANALAAALAAGELGVPPETAAAVLERFEGLPHRHATVAETAGVRWVDDSKATNVGATLAALSGYPERSVHLILGGLAKGQSFAPLRPAVARAAVRVYLIGRDAGRIAAELEGTAPLEPSGTLERAVARARELARPGETVLLAPACASFDQFSGYAERGERFAELVRKEGLRCR